MQLLLLLLLLCSMLLLHVQASYILNDLPSDLHSDTAAYAINAVASDELPMRYDNVQLWRVFNTSSDLHNVMELATVMEQELNAVVWKENSKFLDISIDNATIPRAQSFLTANHLTSNVLHKNIQDLIDAEQLNKHAGFRRARATQRNSMNWNEYHKLDTIYAFMRELRVSRPDICRLYTIGKSVEGRPLKVLRVSTNPSENKKIWIDGGIHAREWISPATVTYIMNQIVSNWNTQPGHITDKTWYFMPVMNPDGYVYSHTTNRLWRKNRSGGENAKCRGVDLNRNFDIGWTAKGSSSNTCSDTYRGNHPGSEPETDAVVRFLKKRESNMDGYLTFHSYGQMIVYPWAYKDDKSINWRELQRVADRAAKRIKETTQHPYQTSVTYKLLGIAGGGSDDWAKNSLHSRFVYTVELRDRGHHGFVLPPDQIMKTAIEGLIVTDTVANAIDAPPSRRN